METLQVPSLSESIRVRPEASGTAEAPACSSLPRRSGSEARSKPTRWLPTGSAKATGICIDTAGAGLQPLPSGTTIRRGGAVSPSTTDSKAGRSACSTTGAHCSEVIIR